MQGLEGRPACSGLDGDSERTGARGGRCPGGYEAGKIVLRDDASSTAEGVTGEIKDLVVVGQGASARIITTGVSGDKPGRQGDVAAWRFDRGKLVRDAAIVSRNGEETRARGVVVVPGKQGASVLTVGHAKNKTAMVRQVLSWQLPAPK